MINYHGNTRASIWSFTSLWISLHMTNIIISALIFWFNVFITENLYIDILYGFTACCTVCGYIAGSKYDNKFQYDKKCAKANNDMQWLNGIFRKEVLIIVFINVIATLLFVLYLKLFGDLQFPKAN